MNNLEKIWDDFKCWLDSLRIKTARNVNLQSVGNYAGRRTMVTNAEAVSAFVNLNNCGELREQLMDRCDKEKFHAQFLPICHEKWSEINKSVA